MRKMKRLVFSGLVGTWLMTGAIAPDLASAQTAAVAKAPAPVLDAPVLDAPVLDAPVLDAATKGQIIAAAAQLLTDNYVFPDMGARAAEMLTQNLAAGKYDAATTPAALATQLTDDLQDLTHDKHMRVFAPGEPPRRDFPPGPPLPLGLFGFSRADRLKGNIGYFAMNGILDKEDTKKGADTVMAMIASTDALIIDLRNNGGGNVDAVAYLESYFFDGKTPIQLSETITRKPGTNEFDRRIFSTEPTSVSYVGKPVFLITSPRTFSGGEAFAYDLQALKRAKVAGEVTGGGANPGFPIPIGAGFTLFVSGGRSESPVTHTNWEGVGIQPDIASTAEQSFAAAYAAALDATGRPAPASAATLEGVIDTRLLFPPRTTPAPGSDTALRQWIGGLTAGHPPEDILGADFLKDMKPYFSFFGDDLRRRGALQTLTFAQVDVTGADVYDATFADKSSVQYIILLGPDGKIVSCDGQEY